MTTVVSRNQWNEEEVIDAGDESELRARPRGPEGERVVRPGRRHGVAV